MGLFSPSIPSPPPPPPIPPAANPQTIASPQVQSAGNAARARIAGAAGSGFNGTDISKPLATGAGPEAKTQLLGQ